MRITIDTELQAIIVPDSYYLQVDRLYEECSTEHNSQGEHDRTNLD